MPAPAPLIPARPAFTADGTPYSEQYDDVYHSADGGLGQARHVFLGGNGLPQRWRGRESFVIVETGFGLGLNFLATWQAWRGDAARPERLHFVSVEKHPYSAADLAALLRRWPELDPLSSQLLRAWPPLVPGFHRLHFEGAGVTLTLLFGDIAALLPQLRAAADAIYLDGFAPERNPEMWSNAVFEQMARIARPNATLATWCVAGVVRQGLADAGFIAAKRPGYGRKREMLAASLPASQTCRTYAAGEPCSRHAIVIGAGLAGTHAAQRLAARGWQVEVLEQGGAPAQGASGNLAGVLRPVPSVDDNRLARLTRAGFFYALGQIAALSRAGHAVRWHPCGVLHLARDPGHEARQRQAVEALGLPPEFVRAVSRTEAAALACWPVAAGGWWFPAGGWINPPSLCAANLAGHGENIRVRYGVRAQDLEHDGRDWRVLDATGALLGRAPVLILANGIQVTRFEQACRLPLRCARGQVSHLPVDRTPPLDIVVCRLGYVTPAVDGVRCAGATFLADDSDPGLREAEHRENLARLDFMLPGYADRIDAAALDGRVGFRALSPDRLPLVGALPRGGAPEGAPGGAQRHQVPRLPGLYGLLGYGARGLVWAALGAELLASVLSDEPQPLPADLIDALDPARFLVRSQRRARAAVGSP
jgi:tRNA 5-methylaminomethyl-2-thiouridine biosynthesis bifunctional protein